MLKTLRNRFHELYDHRQHPRRKDRAKPKFLVSFECGEHPKLGRDPKQHLHVYMWNAAGVATKNLRDVRYNIAGRNAHCHITKFKTGRIGAAYGLKTYGTAADNIQIIG